MRDTDHVLALEYLVQMNNELLKQKKEMNGKLNLCMKVENGHAVIEIQKKGDQGVRVQLDSYMSRGYCKAVDLPPMHDMFRVQLYHGDDVLLKHEYKKELHTAVTSFLMLYDFTSFI